MFSYLFRVLFFQAGPSHIPDIKGKLQLTDAALGGVLFALPAGQLIGMMISGYLVIRFASKRILTIVAALYPAALLLLGFTPTKLVLRASGVLIVSGLVVAVTMPHLLQATPGFFLVGFGVSSIVPLCYSLAGKSKTMMPGVAIAAVLSIRFLRFLSGPPLIGFISQALGLQRAFLLIALLGLGTNLMAGKIQNRDNVSVYAFNKALYIM